jgi:hypothetical protein
MSSSRCTSSVLRVLVALLMASGVVSKASLHKFGRNLQTADELTCDSLLKMQVGVINADYCSCAKSSGQLVVECEFTECPHCETIEGQDTCALMTEDAVVDAVDVRFLSGKSCTQYVSGYHTGTVCQMDNADGTCAVSMDGVMCNSCQNADCANGDSDYLFDCSNIAGGAVYAGCDKDIPNTSPFVPFGSDLFQFDDCFDALDMTSSPTETPSGALSVATHTAVAVAVMAVCLMW